MVTKVHIFNTTSLNPAVKKG